MYSLTALPLALSCTRFTARRVASKLACRPFLLKNAANRSLAPPAAASTSRVGCSIARGTVARVVPRRPRPPPRADADADASTRVVAVVTDTVVIAVVASETSDADGRRGVTKTRGGTGGGER
jgi:hypothetical protein